MPSVSPDGTRVAYVDNNNSNIYVANIDGTEGTKVTEGTNPSWSPNSSRLIFSRGTNAQSDIYTSNADGSGETRVTNTPDRDEDEGRFSPTGDRIAYTAQASNNSTPEIYIRNVDGSNEKQITTNSSPSTGSYNPRWTLDGQHIAYLTLDTSDSGSIQIFTRDTNGTAATRAYRSPLGVADFDLR